ncbi:MAG: hypothetical protein DHS80DRAFT_31606 [Piptocephalis tieghemiana]|nr:MAG: hypothetical protein DHS80DRAFT_31606 [Piptocephalis tieghemiana]
MLFRSAMGLGRRAMVGLAALSVHQRHCHREFGTVQAQAITTLKHHTKGIPIPKGSVHVLREPREFYQTIKGRIEQAKRQITLSSLYIGTSEQDLVQALHNALRKEPGLKVTILLDGLRGTRPSSTGESSVSLLAPLVREFPDRVRFSLYQTPDLPRFLSRQVPPRFHEVVGIMHVKAMVFDDCTLLTGANLSVDYFTNRQDRYHLFSHVPSMANYYHELVSTLSDLSFAAIPTPSSPEALILQPPKGMPHPQEDSESFRTRAHDRLERFILHHQSDHGRSEKIGLKDGETLLFPTIQATPLGIHQDATCLLDLLSTLSHPKVHSTLTTGYFNLDDPLQQAILSSSSTWDLIIASPKANGFYTAKDVARHVPNVYTNVEYAFQRQIQSINRSEFIRLHEYYRPGWTYHAKGIWLNYREDHTEKADPPPFLITLGSPNYGYRSMHRDIEAHAYLVSEDNELCQDWEKERDYLMASAQPITIQDTQGPERRGPWWVRAVSPVLRRYF